MPYSFNHDPDTRHLPKVCFAFSSQNIGGAERSMVRLIRECHDATLQASVLLMRGANGPLSALLEDVPSVSISDGSLLEGLRFLRDIKPDIFYGFGFHRILWAFAARLAGVRVHVGAERNSWPRRVDIPIRMIEKYFVNGYIANTQLIADRLVASVGVPMDRAYVAYNGIDFEESTEDITRPDEWGDPTIVCVANIQPRKGQIYLLRAAGQLRAEFPHLKVLFVGKDFTNGEFSNQAHREGLQDLYVATGYQQDVRAIVKASDLFVLPAIANEGMPTAVLEAMAVGTAVVATDIGGTKELVHDGRTGSLVEPASVSSLTAAIRRLLTDHNFSEELCSNARELVLQRHSVSNMRDSHLAAFETLMNR